MGSTCSLVTLHVCCGDGPLVSHSLGLLRVFTHEYRFSDHGQRNMVVRANFFDDVLGVFVPSQVRENNNDNAAAGLIVMLAEALQAV